MRYKVFCSNGYDGYSFYCDNNEKAHLLFNMAVASEMFSYVDLAEVTEECFLVKEWANDGEYVD